VGTVDNVPYAEVANEVEFLKVACASWPLSFMNESSTERLPGVTFTTREDELEKSMLSMSTPLVQTEEPVPIVVRVRLPAVAGIVSEPKADIEACPITPCQLAFFISLEDMFAFVKFPPSVKADELEANEVQERKRKQRKKLVVSVLNPNYPGQFTSFS
jgi:hypothetical protein